MTQAEATSIGWGSGDPIPGTPFRQVVPSAAAEGRLVVLAAEMPPGLHVDEHLHDAEDQITIVISGQVGARIGEDELQLCPGAVSFMPRGIPHALWNDGPEPARVLEIYTPGGFRTRLRGGRP